MMMDSRPCDDGRSAGEVSCLTVLPCPNDGIFRVVKVRSAFPKAWRRRTAMVECKAISVIVATRALSGVIFPVRPIMPNRQQAWQGIPIEIEGAYGMMIRLTSNELVQEESLSIGALGP